VPVLVLAQRASLVLEYCDFESVVPSDWHRVPLEHLYPESAAPNDFVRLPEQAVVASLVPVLALVSDPILLEHWGRSIRVCRNLV
jgi:hypothetical protein